MRICLAFQIALGSLLALVKADFSAAADCATETARTNKHYTSASVNLRNSPSRYGDILVTLPKGQVVYAFSTSGEWSRANVSTMNITGYIATRYLMQECVEGEEITRNDLSNAQIVAILMNESQGRYRGSCPCPFYTDRAGRRCGRRSAYSRPGGASPLCYASDVTPAMITAFKSER